MNRWRRWAIGCFAVALSIGIGILGGCTTANMSGDAPLPAVSPLPTSPLPDWIEQISPTGEAAPTVQIRIRFKHPLIPVERLESKDQEALLRKFELLPPLPGQFRFLTPRMVGFQADRALPKATRVKVTLKAGLADLAQHRLNQDFAWTFNTESIQLTDLPGSPPAGMPADQAIAPFDLKPVLKFTSNVELNLASLKSHLSLQAIGVNQTIPLAVGLEPSAPLDPAPSDSSASAQFDPSAQRWVYQAEPQRSLLKATRYRLAIAPGVTPAQGNVASEAPFTSQIATYSPFEFQSLTRTGQANSAGPSGRFAQGTAELQFNNELDVESAFANIRVAPNPKRDLPLLQVSDRVATLNPWAFEPATTYTITLDRALKDTYGQTLGKVVTLRFDTGDLAPNIWAPSGLNIFPSGKNLQLNLSTVNLDRYKAAFQRVEPTDLIYVDSAYPDENGDGLLPNPRDWQESLIKPKSNQSIDLPVPLQTYLGKPTGMLAYGVQARTNHYREDGQDKWNEPTMYGLVQVTNLGVFAQWFPQSGLVRVHHLSNGAAAANVAVQVYPSRLETKSRSALAPCATGTTDRGGSVRFDRADLQKCMETETGFAEPAKLLVIAQEGSDWAFTRTYEYSGAYEYGIDAGWTGTKPESRGIIFSDRQLYQPGEKAWLTGVATYLQNGKLQLDQRATYAITLKDPSGKSTDLGTKITNEYGTFSLEVPFAKTQPLGYYSIQAKSEDGVEINGEFRVAEFKPPNFRVELALDPGQANSTLNSSANSTSTSIPQPIVLPSQTITAKTHSQYLFGSPVEGGQAQYYVTRQQTDFAPPGWKGFSFGRRWFYPEAAPTVASDVLQTTQTLNPQGESQETIRVAADLPYPMTYRVDAQVSDVSNLAVSDSKSFLALPHDRLIGLKTDFVADAGKAFPVTVIVTNPNGAAIADQPVRLELQQMIYSRATRLIEGSRTDQNQVEFKTVATADTRSAQVAQAVMLTAPSAGSYRIRAQFAVDRDEVKATDVQLWVTGNTPTNWSTRYRNDRLELQLDKDRYQPGEIATVLIQSPYPEAELYFAVVRHEVLYQTVTKVKGSAPKLQFRVTPDMLPNAAIEAVLVRQGKPISQVEPGQLDKLVRIGFAPFATDVQRQYLQVETAVTPSLQPGQEQTVHLALKDAAGKPVQGQITLLVVNEAVLQLSGYRPPDLVKTVYAAQPISTRLSDNRPNVVLQPQTSPIEKGWGYGGGLSLGAGSTRIRSDFRSLAYYNAALATDANGQARATFKLPDDLTTWRVMAVATDGKLHFGNHDVTFTTTKPLISAPLIPQFVRPGDRLQLGVAVTNNTGQTGTLSVQGEVTEPLKFEQAATLQQTIGAGTQAFRFPVIAHAPGDAKLRFTTQLNGAADTLEVPLVTQPLEVIEQVTETGNTRGEAKIPIDVGPAVANDRGGLDLSLASSLIPTLNAPIQQVLDQADLPFLEPAASQLAIAANLQFLGQRYGQAFARFHPSQQAAEAIERLQKLQRPDGGFASMPGHDRSDPFVTPYAATHLARAMKLIPQESLPSGTSPKALLAPLTTYLNSVLADPGQYDFCQDSTCKNRLRLAALQALAELGNRRSDFLSDLFEHRSQLDPINQMQLARYLLQTPGWQAEGQQLANQWQQILAETSRQVVVDIPAEWRWLNSPTIAQSQALRLLLVQQARSETIAKLLQGLLTLRRHGTWNTTFDNAEALTALVEYSQQQPSPPSFEATAQLAGKTLIQTRFDGYRNASQTATVPMSDLPHARQDLILKKSGSGTLYYQATYRYRLQGSQPGRLNGLRVSRTIRPANQDKILYQTGLYAPEPLEVAVGQVFDIGLEIITDRRVDHVLITDPLPAGFEAVDNSFQTTTPYFRARGDSWQLKFQTIYRDRVLAFGDQLAPGVYTLHYLVRSVTPGTFQYPGAEARLQYAPDEFGRSASATLVVRE